jgi:hypothetical protein
MDRAFGEMAESTRVSRCCEPGQPATSPVAVRCIPQPADFTVRAWWGGPGCTDGELAFTHRGYKMAHEMKVEVYLKSFPVSRNVELYTYSLHHTYCAPELAELASGLLDSGRVLKPDSAAVLSVLEAAAQRSGQQVQVYDVGQLRGRLKALMAGVWKTPTVVLDGEKHVGPEVAKEALLGLGKPEERTGRDVEPAPPFDRRRLACYTEME